MTKNNLRSTLTLLIMILLSACGGNGDDDTENPTPISVEAAEEEDSSLGITTRIQRSTVYLMQTYEEAGTQTISCVGSGTLISENGLILTNAHLAQALGPCRGEQIIVALPVRLDEPPVPTYLAEIVQTDNHFDLAVLQISASLDGSQIDPQTLNLPFVPIGDPSTLFAGNTLMFSGYPDTGSSSVSLTENIISGITAERNGGRFAWFRLVTPLSGGISGGGAYDANGRLVGIPTSAAGTDGSLPGPMCLGLQDNNHDGLITERDACVPVGAGITTVRPINFAIPLIESAKNGFQTNHEDGFPLPPPIGSPGFSRLFFSTQIDNQGSPTQIVSQLPSGSPSLFLFFDYDNMRAGIPYEIRVARDGISEPLLGVGPLAWGGDQKGTWYSGTENTVWQDGTYEFTLLLNGEAVESASIQVSENSGEATFSDLTFGIPGSSGGFATTGTLLPAEVAQIDVTFNFNNIPTDQDWTEIWYLDGTEIFNLTRLWDRESSGSGLTVSAINYEGLPLGTYRLELLIGDRLAATGDVTLGGNPGAQSRSVVFSNVNLSNEIDREGNPTGQQARSGESLPLGTNSIYSFVDWDFMPTNLEWTYRWFLDGRLVASSTELWDAGGVGQGFWIGLESDHPLPEGVYAIEVLVKNQPMFSADVSIGSGTQPISGGETESEEVSVSGQVLDALTGKGIAGAMVVVLDVSLESAQFTWDEAEFHTHTITDREGRFAFTDDLPRRNYYTFYIFAEGYITVVEDNFWILGSYPSEIDIVIQMSRP